MVVGSGDGEGAFLEIAALCPDVALVDQVLTGLDCACAPGLVQGKKLYPLLAQRFGTTPGAVEKAVRSAMHLAQRQFAGNPAPVRPVGGRGKGETHQPGMHRHAGGACAADAAQSHGNKRMIRRAMKRHAFFFFPYHEKEERSVHRK